MDRAGRAGRGEEVSGVAGVDPRAAAVGAHGVCRVEAVVEVREGHGVREVGRLLVARGVGDDAVIHVVVLVSLDVGGAAADVRAVAPEEDALDAELILQLRGGGVKAGRAQGHGLQAVEVAGVQGPQSVHLLGRGPDQLVFRAGVIDDVEQTLGIAVGAPGGAVVVAQVVLLHAGHHQLLVAVAVEVGLAGVHRRHAQLICGLVGEAGLIGDLAVGAELIDGGGRVQGQLLAVHAPAPVLIGRHRDIDGQVRIGLIPIGALGGHGIPQPQGAGGQGHGGQLPIHAHLAVILIDILEIDAGQLGDAPGRKAQDLDAGMGAVVAAVLVGDVDRQLLGAVGGMIEVARYHGGIALALGGLDPQNIVVTGFHGHLPGGLGGPFVVRGGKQLHHGPAVAVVRVQGHLRKLIDAVAVDVDADAVAGLVVHAFYKFAVVHKGFQHVAIQPVGIGGRRVVPGLHEDLMVL